MASTRALRAATRSACCPTRERVFLAKPDSIQRKRRPRRYLIILIVALLAGGIWLYNTVSELGPGILPHPGQHRVDIRLLQQPVYQIRKKDQVLGVNAVRIVSKRQPQEFVVLSGVPRKMLDKVYGKPVDLGWANSIANQFLKMRQSTDDGSPLSVEIQQIKTRNTGTIAWEGQQLPYWQVAIRFKLSNESEPRTYDVGVIRHLSQDGQAGGQENMMLTYAQNGAYEKALITDLLGKIQFQQN